VSAPRAGWPYELKILRTVSAGKRPNHLGAARRALEQQKTVQAAIGTLALEKGLLTAEQIKKILTEQKKTNLRFGEQAVAMGSLTETQVEALLQEQQVSHRVLLGEALVSKGYLTLETLEKS
jgi:dsRNA-specific ribonuclease